MKLTKATLKRIIKEELSSVLNEVNTGPDFKDSNIPLKFKDKFLSLVHGGELDQAQVLIDAVDGDPEWIKKYLGDIEHPSITIGKKKASQPVAGARFPWKAGSFPSFGDVWDQLTGQSPYQMIQKSIEQDERTASEEYSDALSRGLDFNARRELKKWWNEKINASKRELELLDSGWDHYEVLESRIKRLLSIRPKPEVKYDY